MLDRDRRFPVLKTQLLQTLRKNREAHVKNYEAALVEYRKAVIEELTNQINRRAVEKARATDGLEFSMDTARKDDGFPAEPKSFADHYDQAIGLLEMTTLDSIDINAPDYRKYVLDEWEWRNEFETSTMSYNNAGGRR